MSTTIDQATRKVLMDYDDTTGRSKDGTVSPDEIAKLRAELPKISTLNEDQKTQLSDLLYREQNVGINYFTFKTTSEAQGNSSFETKVAKSILNSEVARKAVAGSGAFSDGVLTLHEVVKSPNLISALYTGGVLSQLDSGDYLLAAIHLEGSSYVIHEDSRSYNEVKNGFLSVKGKDGKPATIEVPSGWKIQKMNQFESYFQTSQGLARFAALDRPGYYAVSPEKEGKQSYKIWNEFGDMVDSGEFRVDNERPAYQSPMLSFDKNGKLRIESEGAYYVRTQNTPILGSNQYSVSVGYKPAYQSNGSANLQYAYPVNINVANGYGNPGTHNEYKGGVFNVETVYDKSGTAYGHFVKNTKENRPTGRNIGTPSASALEANGIYLYDSVFVLKNEPYFVYNTGTKYSPGSIEIRNKKGEIVKTIKVKEKCEVTGFSMLNGKIEMNYHDRSLGEEYAGFNLHAPIF